MENNITMYTYNDWLEGKICLFNTQTYSRPEDADKFKRVKWEEIEPGDRQHIKEKQEEIFKEQVSELLNKWQEEFNQNYSSSKTPDFYLSKEKKQVRSIMFDQFPAVGTTIIRGHWNITYTNFYLQEIQDYIKTNIVEGAPLDFDFIHSPEFPFYQKDKIYSQVYAEALWQYFNSLNTFEKEEEGTASKIEVIEVIDENDEIDKQDDKEPKNPYPSIFESGYAYNFFKELKDYLVRPGTELADYSFIFDEMKKSYKRVIHKTVTHPIYIEFLKNHEGADIYAPKLKYPKSHKRITKYKEILSRHSEYLIDKPKKKP
ncbi:MAG TPA: hypothetical protein VLC98_16785 [Phnomibacter sp.]|nr:hypothetical protein [Phnomibacter sp.]